MGGKGSGGHNRKPDEAKRRIGNPGHASKRVVADVVMLPVQQAPEPHRPLGTVGKDVWSRIWLACAAWLKPQADAEAVLLVCEASDERSALRYRVLSDPDDHKSRKSLRELDSQISSALGELGMNPVDRARLGVAEVKENPFMKLHAEIAARRNAAG
jgi:hypothetical protein